MRFGFLSCVTLLWACLFFFNDTATTEIYPLSLHDALPIYPELPERGQDLRLRVARPQGVRRLERGYGVDGMRAADGLRSEEHTSELQSRQYLVCRLLLEKTKRNRHGM